jgi:autotransporter-associated beta strand protein/parallel beta-helix repeat protein
MSIAAMKFRNQISVMAGFVAPLLLVFGSIAIAGQGAQRMLYTVPNNSFIENPSGDSTVTINDISGSIATLQTLINSARSANPGSIIIIHLLSGATYSVSSAGLVLSSQECLVGSGAIVKAANSSVTVPLVIITNGASNVSVAGGVYDGNGANIYGIFAPASSSRVNIDKVTIKNCGQDCIQLNGNGSGTFDNEITITRCDLSGSSGHSGISIWNATQTTCIENYCHNNSVGIWIGNGGYCNIANNICVSNSTGINCNSGSDNYIVNNTCNFNGTGIYAGGSANMIVSDLFAGNSVAGIYSSGSGNIFSDNLFTNGNAATFSSHGSGDMVIAYKGALNASSQSYFYPPLIDDQHNATIVNGMDRYDLYDNQTTSIDAVQSEYNSALSANPGSVIVLHLNGTYTVGSNPLTLQSDTCIILGGTIQINSSTGANQAIYASGQNYISISGGTIDGGTTTSSHAGNNGIYFTGCSMFQIDGVTLQNFGTRSTRVGGSDVLKIDHGSTPRIFTRNTIVNGSARGLWLATSGVRDIVSDNTVSQVQMDGIDCDASTFASLIKNNYSHDNSRCGVFVEQSASHNLLLGNICNYNGHDLDLFNNSSTPRSATAYNALICNSCWGGNLLQCGSTGDGTSVESSDNFIFGNSFVNGSVNSQNYGSANYYSQNYFSSASFNTSSGVQDIFNSPEVSGYFEVRDVNSGLDAIVQAAAVTNNTPVVTAVATNSGNNVWQFIPTDSGWYQIQNKNSGLDMNVAGAATNGGASIIQWPFGGSQNDQWMPMFIGNGAYSFVNRHSGLVLDVPGASTTPGAQLDQQSFSGAANQQFYLFDVVPPPLPTSLISVFWNSGGAPDGNWMTTANWGGAEPQSFDGLVFGTGSQTAATNNFPAASIFENLFFTNGAAAFTLNGNAMTLTNPTETTAQVLSGGGIDDAAASVQTIALPLSLSAGNHTIQTEIGASQLNLNGAVNRNPDATAQFIVNGGNINCTGAGLTNANGILGGWAAIGLAANAGNWAAIDASSNVIAYSAYTTASGGANMGISSSGATAANNFKINSQSGTANTLNSTTAGTYDVNSIAWNVGNSSPGGDQTVNISSGQILRLGPNGGILNVHAGSRTLNIGNNGGGSITAGGTANAPGEISLYAVPFSNGNQRLQINAPINDNGNGKVSVNVLGDVELKQNGNFSGGLFVNQGRVQADTIAAFGAGPVYVFPGGCAFPWNSGNSGTISNNFFISGFGSSQDQLALRCQANVTFAGTITLSGTALVGAGNSMTWAGQITGPGGLWLRGNYGTGSLHLDEAAPNNYAGDTTIDATFGNSITIWIDNAGHNNIMPSGTNTGNLILKGGASNLAEIDIGGSTQTVNGLISSNNASQTLVTSNPGGGTLNVGANDATSEFDGIIGDTSSQGTTNINLTKIGAGTLTLGGANNYSGVTTVSNGVLALGSSATISNSSKIIIAAGATLDASARGDQTFILGAGQTLQGNGTVNVNLTVTTNATVIPGDAANIGALSVFGIVQLEGATILKLNATASSSDQIGADTFIYGGTLAVTNISGALAAGQTFQLFPGNNYSGAFSVISLPQLPNGLVWSTNNLFVNGTLQVVSSALPQPKITDIEVSGTNLIFNGTNGTSGGNYYLLASTNLALPLAQWPAIATNSFDGSGNFNFTNPLDPNSPRQFYLLELPGN